MEVVKEAPAIPSNKYFETILPSWAAVPGEAVDRLKGVAILCVAQYFYGVTATAHVVKAAALYKSGEQDSQSKAKYHMLKGVKALTLAWAFSFYYPDLLDLSVISNGNLIFTACVVATILKPTSLYMALDFVEKRMHPNDNHLSHEEIKALSVGSLLDYLVDGRVTPSNVFGIGTNSMVKRQKVD